MGIGAKLQRAIEAKNTNVNEVAKRANISPSVLYSIIRRDSKSVDINILITIANILGVSVEYFGDDYEPIYYTDPETARLAQLLHDNPQYKVMFDSTKDLDAESVQKIIDFIKYQRHLEGYDD